MPFVDPDEFQDPDPSPQPSGFGRSAAIAGGGLVKGALYLPGLVQNVPGVANELLNRALSSAGITERYQTPYIPPTERTAQTLGKLGVPEPVTGSEKVLGVGSEMLGGAVATPPMSNLFQPEALYRGGTPQGKLTAKQYADWERRVLGYKVPPSEVQPSWLTRRLESIGGKAALKQQATIGNQDITSGLAARGASIPRGEPATTAALAEARTALAGPYREVADLSPTAAKTLEELRQVKYDANLQWAYFRANKNPEIQKAAQALTDRAKTLERVLEREAASKGSADLLTRFRAARTEMAQNFQVRDVTNPYTMETSAREIGDIGAEGGKLTGNLASIARFANQFSKYAGSGASTPQPGVSALEPTSAALLGMTGRAATGDPSGWLASGLAFLGSPVRAGLLSNAVQGPRSAYDLSRMVQPSMIAGREVEDLRRQLYPDYGLLNQ